MFDLPTIFNKYEKQVDELTIVWNGWDIYVFSCPFNNWLEPAVTYVKL